MKRQGSMMNRVLVGLVLSLLLLGVQAAEIASRGSRGGLGQPCRQKHAPECNKGLSCTVDGFCASPGSLKTTCLSDETCKSGFCGALGHCSTPRRVGKSCSRDAQCISKSCSSNYKRCVRAGIAVPSSLTSTSAAQTASFSSASSSSSVPSATSTSTSPVSGPAPTQTSPESAASDALALVQPVSDSAAFSSPALLQTPGTVSTRGIVAIVTTELGPAIEMYAEAGSPAVLQQVLQTALLRRQQSENTLSFNYNVAAFVTSDANGGQCSIIASINGDQLSPPILLKSSSQSGTAFYRYTGTVSSYALALVCDTNSKARVQYDTVAVSSSSSSTSTAPTSTAATSTSTSATSTSASSSSASITAAPTPTLSCWGTPNCGFESGWADEFSIGDGADAECVITDDASKTHAGQYAQQCTVPDNKWAYVYVAGGRSHSYIVNSTYTMTFWVKFEQGAYAAGLKCSIYHDLGGEDPVAYTGICPLTNAAPQNGYYQVAVPFTAPAEQMVFYITMTKVPGTYYIDDISILDGTLEDVSYATATLSTPYTPTTAAAQPTGTQSCVGIQNCGFESGDLTSYTAVVRGHTRCGITSNSTDVYDGLYAYRCSITDDYPNSQGGLIMRVPDANWTKGITYDFSFWSKNNNASDINCYLGKGGAMYFNDVMPIVSTSGTNGYSKYSTTFTARDNGAIGTIDCRFTKPAKYYLDSFALTPVPA